MNEINPVQDERDRIALLLRKVPQKINGGSWDQSVAYKAAAIKAQKEAAKALPKLQALSDARRALEAFYA